MDITVVVEALEAVLSSRSADVLAPPPSVSIADGRPVLDHSRDLFDEAAAGFAARLLATPPCASERLDAVAGLVVVPGGWRQVGDTLLAALAETGTPCLRMCKRRGRLEVVLPPEAGLEALAARAVAVAVSERVDPATGCLRSAS
jgi:hypothetical protein